MKINSNGMAYGEFHKQAEQGFGNRSGNNHGVPIKGRLYVIKKQLNTAEDFSRLILREFNGRKVTQDFKFDPSTDASHNRGGIQKIPAEAIESKAMSFLNEYWA